MWKRKTTNREAAYQVRNFQLFLLQQRYRELKLKDAPEVKGCTRPERDSVMGKVTHETRSKDTSVRMPATIAHFLLFVRFAQQYTLTNKSWTTFAESNSCQGPSAWIVAKPEKTGSINGPRNWPVSAGLHRQRHSINLTPIQTETANELFQEFQVMGKICQRKKTANLSTPWTTIRHLSAEWARWPAGCFKTIRTVDVVCRQDIYYTILEVPSSNRNHLLRKKEKNRLSDLLHFKIHLCSR